MQRHCTTKDWEYWPDSMTPAEAPCGKTYDDEDHSTLCPHDPLPAKLSEGELTDLYDRLRAEEEDATSGQRSSG